MTGAVMSPEICAANIHRSPLLESVVGVVHGVTKRIAGAGLADGNVGYSAPRDRADAWEMRRRWCAAAGLDPNSIVVAYQTHGRDVAVVSTADRGRGADPESRPIGQADALVTADSGVVLMTLHADCMPILLCDPTRRVVASVHAGWRGTTADVVGSTVQTMVEFFACKPTDLIAHLGPAIGGCCYEVGDDVVAAWKSTVEKGGHALVQTADRLHFDLARANRTLLERRGVPAHRIDESGICTKCCDDEWFSHRGQGAGTGRYAAFIALTQAPDGPRGTGDEFQ